VDWIHVAQDRDQWRPVLSTVNVPACSIKGGEFCSELSGLSSFSVMALCRPVRSNYFVSKGSDSQ
jgi:hypothetical protein